MPENKIKKVRQIGLIVLLLLLTLGGLAVALGSISSAPVQAAGSNNEPAEWQPISRPPLQQDACYCSSDIYECFNFETHEEAQACFDYCNSVGRGDVHGLDIDFDGLACESLPSAPTPLPGLQATPYTDPYLRDPVFRSLVNAQNVINNGNFQADFYFVPDLGFEPPDNGWIPNGWNWYKGQAYGKYNIYGNESFGLVCPDDFRLLTDSTLSLSFHMQSTDQPDARLGVYQTVNVAPGQSYLFVVSGTIQAQAGADSPDVNNRVEVLFDHTGGSDWQATPHEDWIWLPWKEQELEFNTSGPDDPDLAKVEGYYTIVKAQSNKMTVFIEAWRRLPNWRTTIFTVDCLSLAPLNQVDVGAVLPRLSQFSTTAVDAALKASPGVPASAAPASLQPVTGQPAPVPAAVQPPIAPPAGGILDTKSNWLLMTLASVVVISGLVGAGVWNARRRKE